MLRVMKQKAQAVGNIGSDDDNKTMFDSRNCLVSPSAATTTTGIPPSSHSPTIVSHIPVSIASSKFGPASADSSISSQESTSCLPLQRIDHDDEQSLSSNHGNHKIVPSCEDSTRESQGVKRKTTLSPPTAKSIISPGPNARKISYDEIADQSSPKPPAKKLRTTFSTANVAVATKTPSSNSSNVLLLAKDTDESALNPLHVFVRSQIEVFTATPQELAQPAPGRKHPIQLHQVGLRCIHCRHVASKKRVKRAVCYPSSVARVYHSVSDMKFDHFSNCKELPPEVRAKFETLKADGKKKNDKKPTSKGSGYSSSTAQYYHDTAAQMGMVDGPGGIFMATNKSFPPPLMVPQPQKAYDTPALFVTPQQVNITFPPIDIRGTLTSNSFQYPNIQMQKVFASMMKDHSCAKLNEPQASIVAVGETAATTPVRTNSNRSCIPLAASEDSNYLNPLHCFVRKHVEVFAANEDDIAAPAPGRKHRVLLGQVGIRCKHCAVLPLKDRVKRAVCYPPSVSGIYHSVSNMKFDHFGICRGLPADARQEFTTLKASCSRRGTSGNNNFSKGGSASSTAQYYHDSAVRLGLADTPSGIRICEKKRNGETAQRGRSDGISALVMAATQTE